MRRRSLAILLRSIASTRSCALNAGDVAHALHELNAVCADAQIETGDLLEILVHQRRIFLLDGHAGADRAAADAEIAQVVRGLVRRASRRARSTRRTP